MNYQRIYESLIFKAQERPPLTGYTEKHHIVPRCLGGKEEHSNLVILSAEEHFLAHQLLVKIYPKHDGLAYAAKLMTMSKGKGRVGNKLYGWLKKRASIAQSNQSSKQNKLNNPSNKPEVKAMRREQLLKNNPMKIDSIKQKATSKSIAKTKERMKNPSLRNAWVEIVTKAKVEQNSYAKQGKSLSDRWKEPDFKRKMVASIKAGKEKSKFKEVLI
jgi:hypothetical protein